MKVIDIKAEDVFTLDRVSYGSDSKGEERMVCDYVMRTGVKNSLEIVFEGYAKRDVLRVKKQYKFKSLLSMFDDRRLYFKGVVFMDGQFEDVNGSC